MKYFFWLSVAMLIGSSRADAQEMDSLLKLSQSKVHDSILSEAHIQLAVLYWDINPDSAIYFSRKALDFANSSGNPFKVASSYKTLGVSYDYQGNMDSCLKYLNAGLQEYTKLQRIDKISHVFNDIAAAWLTRGNYELALRNHLKALELRKQFGNEKFISMSYNNIGLIYRSKKEYDKAISFYRQSLQLKEKLKDQQGLLNTYINLGSVYHSKGVFDSAYHFASIARQLANTLNKKNDVLAAKGNMAIALTSMKRYEEALQLLEGAEKEVAEGGDKKIWITLYETYGNIYTEMGRHDLALKYLNKGFEYSQQIDRMESKEVFSRKLAAVYASLGDYQKSYSFLHQSRMWNDSLFNEENNRQANELSAVYESTEKEKQITQLNLEKSMAQSNIKWLILVSIFLGLLTAFIWKAYAVNKRKNNLLNQQNETIQKALKDKEYLMKEIHHRVKNNLQIISSLLSLQSNYIDDKHALEAVNDSRNRVQSMSLIHQSLYSESNMSSVEVKEYIQKLTENLFHSYNIHADLIKLELEVDSFRLDVDTIVPVGLILNELLTNSLKYAFTPGTPGCIRVLLKQKDHQQLQLSVYDNGVGLQHTALNKTEVSFGYKMIQAFLTKLEGEMTIYEEDGTKVDIHFPFQSIK